MSQLIGAQNIMVEHSLHPPPPFLKRGKVNFDYFPQRGESEKLKKCGSIIQVLIFLKGGGLALFPFFQVLSFLHLEITLSFAKLCHAFEEKKIFSATIIL